MLVKVLRHLGGMPSVFSQPRCVLDLFECRALPEVIIIREYGHRPGDVTDTYVKKPWVLPFVYGFRLA